MALIIDKNNVKRTHALGYNFEARVTADSGTVDNITQIEEALVTIGEDNITPNLAMIPAAYKATKLYSVIPSTGDGDFTTLALPTFDSSSGTPVLRVTADTITIADLQAISALSSDEGVIIMDLNGTEYTFVFEALNTVKLYVNRVYAGELADPPPTYYKLQKGDFGKIVMMNSSHNAAAKLGLTSVTPDLSTTQGLTWNSSTDTYTRIGTLSAIATSQSAGNANLPIQSLMKRCALNDDGTVNYYMDATNPINKDGVASVMTSTTDGATAYKLIDSSADFVTLGIEAGQVVKNTTDGTYSIITAVDDLNTLSLERDVMVSGESYEIGSANYGGADGQIMVEIPKFYYYHTLVGTVNTWAVSLTYVDGMELHPAFYKDGEIVDYRYHSAFEGSLWDASTGAMVAKASIPTSLYAAGDKLCSVAGQWAKVNETREEYRAAAAERGTGFRQLDYPIHAAVQLLYLVEYADFNTQAMIGAGRTNLSGGGWTADSYISITGLSIGDGNGTNSVQLGTTLGYLTDYITYRGIENWYGNVWKMVEATIDGRWTGVAAAMPIYYTNNSAYFADQTGDNMKLLCNASYIGTVAGYISNIENTGFGFIPSSVSGGSATTYITDYYYQYSESGRDYWRVFLTGSHAVSGSTAGGFAFYASYPWSTAAVSIAGRLCF